MIAQRSSTTAAARATYTVPELADRWAVDQHKVLRWLHSGELRGLNLATNRSGRPRWRVSAEAVQLFELSRSSGPTPKVARPRRQKAEGYIEFF